MYLLLAIVSSSSPLHISLDSFGQSAVVNPNLSPSASFSNLVPCWQSIPFNWQLERVQLKSQLTWKCHVTTVYAHEPNINSWQMLAYFIVLAFLNKFIHSGYFYSASSSRILLRSAPDTARILCRSFTLKRHRQLPVKDLPKVPTWRLDRNSNSRPSGRKASTLPMRPHVPQINGY